MKSLRKDHKVMFSEVKRFRDLATDKITVEEKPDRFLVKFDFPCEHLIKEEEVGWICSIYKQGRPELCRTYPFKGTTDCPHKET